MGHLTRDDILNRTAASIVREGVTLGKGIKGFTGGFSVDSDMRASIVFLQVYRSALNFIEGSVRL